MLVFKICPFRDTLQTLMTVGYSAVFDKANTSR